MAVKASGNEKRSIHALEASNFFLADVQTGLGPFLAAYLAAAGWNAGRVGMALTGRDHGNPSNAGRCLGGPNPFQTHHANAIFGVVSILVIADLTRGSGRFNFMQGALATAVGMGAALSTSFGGMIIQLSGFRASFLSLGAVALAAFLLVLLAVPETLSTQAGRAPALPGGEPA